MREHKWGKDFVFGTASASYQVEGGLTLDGRSDSIWDDFAREPGRVYMNENGNVACNHWNEYRNDILLMKQFGFKSYRFSISWSRIFPNDDTVPNLVALEHYKDICRALHEVGMTSCVTLYHWDLPSYLQAKGGWANREIVYRFRDYAEVLFDYLGDIVDQWITLNEPACDAYLGHFYGIHAPGHKDLHETLRVIHHLNLAHGVAVKSYRNSGLEAPIGITLNLVCGRPMDDSSLSLKAAALHRAIISEVWTSPLFEGKYPEILKNELSFEFPVEEGDMDLISQKIDFLGFNFYNQAPVRYDESAPFLYSEAPFWEETTDMGWSITPYEMVRTLRWINSITDLPIYITENGCACKDEVTPDKRIHDINRIRFFQKYLEAVEMAIEEGIPVKGYYVWSFMDNYEWTFGYSKRFGIVWIDYGNLERIPKDSAYFWRDVNAGYTVW